MKRTNKIRLTESQLHRVIKESVKNVLKEEEDNYYGGGLPDSYFNDDDFVSPTSDIEDSKYFDILCEIFSNINVNEDTLVNVKHTIKNYLLPISRCITDAIRLNNIPVDVVKEFVEREYPSYRTYFSLSESNN